VDFAAIARASGIRSVARFDSLDSWRDGAGAAFALAGPVYIVLDVAPVPGAVGPKSPGPTAVRGPAFMKALRQRTPQADRS
jgi:hypothetical protein